jgi:hypothetical protein
VNEDEATNYQVPGSHVGLVFNAEVYRLIANFLATPSLITDVGNETGFAQQR